MNNDLEQFSEERLKYLSTTSSIKNGATAQESAALAHIALAAKQAKPALIFDKPDSLAYRRLIQTFEVGTKFYTTPHPAHTEQDDTRRMDWLCAHCVEVRDPQMYGSHAMFHAQQDSEEWDLPYHTTLREQIDKAMLAAAPKPDGTLISEGTKSDSCQWNPDEDSVYFTGCGHEWQFTEGGIEENGITYCPYCSGKIAAPKPESE